MKYLEFRAAVKSIIDPRRQRFDLAKAKALDADLKARMVQYIVRNRWPLMAVLVGPGTELPWLHACGYLYFATSHGVVYYCTCENQHLVSAPPRAA